MQKSDLKILIIEDDTTLGRALEEALRRSGYSTQSVTSATQAKNAMKISEFHGMVVDCMLPQKSGVDTVIELTLDSGQQPVIVLTSGIFRDRTYALEAQLKTKAQAFLAKPFDIAELIKIFDDAFSELIGISHAPLYQLLKREQFSSRDKIQAIQNTEYISGYDLPLVYSMLMDSQISGVLTVEYDNHAPAKIGFHGGQIDQVIYTDTESYFGVLLIEKGFITPEELQEGLEQTNTKPIGQRLVEMASLSPHAIEIVQFEQMVIRLSKTIHNESVKISFAEIEKSSSEVIIDELLFTQLLSDWICSKVSTAWLKQNYTQWLDYPLSRGLNFQKIQLLKHLPAGKTFASILENDSWPHTLQDFLTQNPGKEDDVLQGLHFFLSLRCVYFSEQNLQPQNFEGQTKRLSKILETMQSQNLFEILGVQTKSKPSEIHRAYHELAKNLHPDKLSAQAPADLRELSQKVFSRIVDAHQTLSNDERRNNYLKTLELGYAEEILRAESTFEEGHKLLQTNRFRDARKTFERTLKMKGHRSDAIIYLVWALIKEKRNRTDHQKLSRQVTSLMNQVSHEDRHSPSYFFVKGMHYEIRGQVQKAYDSFKYCLLVEPGFNDARRELAYIKQNYNRKNNTITDDLSQVVTNFFKKKSG